MREPIETNSLYRQAIPVIRQLVAEQQTRRAQLDALPAPERVAYCAQAGENAAGFLLTEPRPLYLGDLLFIAQFVTWCSGEIVTLEELCGSLFANADFFIERGFYTPENIDSLSVAYYARLN